MYAPELIALSETKGNWITTLMDGLNRNVDKETLAIILEQCGRRCQSPILVKKARDIYLKSKNPEEFLGKLEKICKHLRREGNKIYVVYQQCYCPRVNKIPKGQLPGVYCNCSRGWVKELFEGAMGKPVEVIMEKSIINGDNECRFRIVLQ